MTSASCSVRGVNELKRRQRHSAITTHIVGVGGAVRLESERVSETHVACGSSVCTLEKSYFK